MTTTLITGASGGIGEAFARRLAQLKHDLVLVARSEEKLKTLCNELAAKHKISAQFVALDLNAPDSDATLFEETQKRGWQIDWLINNAGFGSMGDFVKLDLERELEMIGLNVMALVALTHRYLPPMRERQSGVIINVSSTASFQPVPFMATYAATKAFVTSFTEAIAEENRPFGIQIMALCPGATKTNFFDAAKMDEPFTVKGLQTAGEVVEAALKGLKRKKSHVISGWANYAVAHLANVAPNSVVTKAVSSKLRRKFQPK